MENLVAGQRGCIAMVGVSLVALLPLAQEESRSAAHPKAYRESKRAEKHKPDYQARDDSDCEKTADEQRERDRGRPSEREPLLKHLCDLRIEDRHAKPKPYNERITARRREQSQARRSDKRNAVASKRIAKTINVRSP